MSSNSEQKNAEAASLRQAALSPEELSTAQVFVASKRIEVGEQLTPEMLTTESISLHDLPPNAARVSGDMTIVGQYARELIRTGSVLTWSVVNATPPAINSLAIPDGMRAVTINVDPRSGVDGWIAANKRVDILLAFVDDDQQKKVATIVQFAKILSVNGRPAANQTAGVENLSVNSPSTVTLQVFEEDARKIELARTIGVSVLCS